MNDLSWWFSFPNALKHLLYISHISRFKSRRSNVDQVTSQLIQSVYGLPVCTGFSSIHFLDFKVTSKLNYDALFLFFSRRQSVPSVASPEIVLSVTPVTINKISSLSWMTTFSPSSKAYPVLWFKLTST